MPDSASKKFDLPLDSLTGMRIILALYVLLGHCSFSSIFPESFQPYLNLVISPTWGVFGFFFLSGFIMWYAYSEKIWGIKEFLVNRFARIYPVYILGVWIVCLRGESLIEGKNIQLAELLQRLVAEIFMVQSWGLSFLETQSFNGPGWTLSVEILFYILFPFLFLIHQKHKASFYAVSTLLGLISFFYFVTGEQQTTTILALRYMFFFITGTFLCIFWKKTMHLFPMRWHLPLLLISTCLLLFGNLLSLAIPKEIVFFAYLPIIYCLASIDHWGKKTFLSSKIMVLGGEISYAVYILHVPILTAATSLSIKFFGLVPDGSFWNRTYLICITLVVTLAASFLIWKFFEKPLRKKIKTYSKQRNYRILPILGIVTIIAILTTTLLGLRLSLRTPDYSSLTCDPSPYNQSQNRDELTRHYKLLKSLSYEPHKIVFLGDSITENWEREGLEYWNRYFKPMGAINLGISNDKTNNVIWRIENGILNFTPSPKFVILLIGVNNIGQQGASPEEIAAGIRKIATLVHAKHPSSKILLLGILPYAQKTHGYFGKRQRLNRKLASLNLPNVQYVDISEYFLNEHSGIKPELSTDLLHLSKKGYEVLSKSLLPLLVEENRD